MTSTARKFRALSNFKPATPAVKLNQLSNFKAATNQLRLSNFIPRGSCKFCQIFIAAALYILYIIPFYYSIIFLQLQVLNSQKIHSAQVLIFFENYYIIYIESEGSKLWELCDLRLCSHFQKFKPTKVWKNPKNKL